MELKLKKAEPEPWTDYEVHLQCVHFVCVCAFLALKLDIQDKCMYHVHLLC